MRRVVLSAVLVPAALVLALGCSAEGYLQAVDLVSGERAFGDSGLRTGVDGYVYVPVSDPGAALNVDGLVFASVAEAPPGTVPAVGVEVSVLVDGTLAAQPVVTDSAGHFAVAVGDDAGTLEMGLDFSDAEPQWTRVTLADLIGDVPSQLVLSAGIVKGRKNLATLGHADAIRSVISINGRTTASNASPLDVTIDVWLSRTNELTAADLLDAGEPVMADETTRTYHAWDVSVPAGSTGAVVNVPWADVDNPAAVTDMLNPNTDRDENGDKLVTIYCTSRPTGEGVTLSGISADLELDIDEERLEPSAASANRASLELFP